MKRKKLGVALALIATTCLVMTGCTSSGTSNDANPTDSAGKSLGKATLLMNWFAQAEQGGYWSAEANGLAKKLGVDITVQQGGPGIQTIPQVAAGKSDFGVANADEILIAASHGLPIVAVMTGFDQNIQCLAYHKGTGINSLADLSGKTVSTSQIPYWPYIEKEFNLKDVNSINITSIAAFRKDKNMVLQCFLTSEPFTMKDQGMTDIGYFSVAKDGHFNAYQNMLFTTESFIKKHPDVVQAVVTSSEEGWMEMLKDPTKTKDLVIKTNPDTDPKVFDDAIALIKSDKALLGPSPGSMTDARWEELAGQLSEIGLLDSSFDYTKAFTTKYSNK